MAAIHLLILTLRILAVALAVALAILIVAIVPSADNGPYMTPFAILLIGLVTGLSLLGYAGGLRDTITQPPPDE